MYGLRCRKSLKQVTESGERVLTELQKQNHCPTEPIQSTPNKTEPIDMIFCMINWRIIAYGVGIGVRVLGLVLVRHWLGLAPILVFRNMYVWIGWVESGWVGWVLVGGFNQRLSSPSLAFSVPSFLFTIPRVPLCVF